MWWRPPPVDPRARPGRPTPCRDPRPGWFRAWCWNTPSPIPDRWGWPGGYRAARRLGRTTVRPARAPRWPPARWRPRGRAGGGRGAPDQPLAQRGVFLRGDAPPLLQVVELRQLLLERLPLRRGPSARQRRELLGVLDTSVRAGRRRIELRGAHVAAAVQVRAIERLRRLHHRARRERAGRLLSALLAVAGELLRRGASL